MKHISQRSNTDRGGKPRGACPECGKSIMLRNGDGKIRIHKLHSTKVICLGSGKPASKAAEGIQIVGWAATRRSN